MQKYIASNQLYKKWFYNKFLPDFNVKFPQFTGKVELTGSRSFDLAYPSSDLEFAVIVPTNEQAEAYDKIRSKFPAAFSAKTKAGLYLMILRNYYRDSEVNIWELEMTLRSQEIHDRITNHIKTTLETWSDSEKLKYIETQENLALLGDTEKYSKNKQWMKILKEN